MLQTTSSLHRLASPHCYRLCHSARKTSSSVVAGGKAEMMYQVFPVNKQEVGYKKATLCFSWVFPANIKAVLSLSQRSVILGKQNFASRSPLDFSGTAQLSRVSACLHSWARAGMHGAAQSRWEMERKWGAI